MDDSEKLRPLVARPGHHARVRVWFDGSCSPNPGGTPQYGWYAMDNEGTILAQQSGSVERMPKAGKTNNTAEWGGLYAALQWIEASHMRIRLLDIYGDSKLVVEQLTGKMRCKKDHLKQFREMCQALLNKLPVERWVIQWIPRKENGMADDLSKAGGVVARPHQQMPLIVPHSQKSPPRLHPF